MKKRYTHQLLTLLLSAAVCVNMCGCQSKTETVETAQPAAVSTETATAATDKDGNKVATAADFSKVTICGTEFNMPCKASDFTGDFSIDTESEKWNSYSICYKNTHIAILGYDEDIKKVNLKKHKPKSILLTEKSHYNINGFTDDMDSDQLIQYFGEPDDMLKDDNGIIIAAKYVFNDDTTKIGTVLISKVTTVSEDTKYEVFISFRDDE